MKDLVVLVPDKNTEAALHGLFSRPKAIGIRSISVDIYCHPQRDSGCYLKGVEFLSPYALLYSHGLMVFDFEGSGAEKQIPNEVEKSIENRLYESGWDDRATAIVIRPELENWVWSNSPHVIVELGWNRQNLSLRDWLKDKGFHEGNNGKPLRPKEAMEAVLWETRKPRSSSIYKELATKVSFGRCSDISFLKLKTTLQKWFPLKRMNG